MWFALFSFLLSLPSHFSPRHADGYSRTRPHFHRQSLFRVPAEIGEGGGVKCEGVCLDCDQLLGVWCVEPFNLLCASLAVILFSYLHYAPYTLRPSREASQSISGEGTAACFSLPFLSRAGQKG
ncbi:hypothetical protein V8C26DRAFT_24477 [Trichoderma gracile]